MEDFPTTGQAEISENTRVSEKSYPVGSRGEEKKKRGEDIGMPLLLLFSFRFSDFYWGWGNDSVRHLVIAQCGILDLHPVTIVTRCGIKLMTT